MTHAIAESYISLGMYVVDFERELDSLKPNFTTAFRKSPNN